MSQAGFFFHPLKSLVEFVIQTYVKKSGAFCRLISEMCMGEVCKLGCHQSLFENHKE